MDTQNTPPVIGISGSSGDSASVRAMVAQIRDAGATPLFLGKHSTRSATADLPKIDALLVMGNNADIDPATYGAARSPKTHAETDTPEGKARADYEGAMLKAALEQKIPVVGVCGGMQRLNVLLGGSLHQDIPELIGNDNHAQQDAHIAPTTPVQPVLINNKSTLGGIAGSSSSIYVPAPGTPLPGMIMENSMHHQAVDRVGSGLRVAAAATDMLPGNKILVEAIEADPQGKYGQQFVLGVQWHPEFGASPLGPLLAKRVVNEARSFALESDRTHPMEEAIQENIKSGMPVGKQPPPAGREGSMAARTAATR